MSNLFNTIIKGNQFNFQPVEFGVQSGYHVDVKDDEGTRWEFRIFHEGDELKMEGENLPSWITDLQPDLIQAIDEHE